MPRNPEVEAWFVNYDGPQKETVLAVREVILHAFPEITECIKWQSPTFVYLGNLASFNPRAKKQASLMFHHGALIPGRHPELEGSGSTARFMTFAHPKDAQKKQGAIESICRAWIEMKSGKGPTGPSPTTTVKPIKNGSPTPKDDGAAEKPQAATKRAGEAATEKAATKKPATKKAATKKPATKSTATKSTATRSAATKKPATRRAPRRRA